MCMHWKIMMYSIIMQTAINKCIHLYCSCSALCYRHVLIFVSATAAWYTVCGGGVYSDGGQ